MSDRPSGDAWLYGAIGCGGLALLTLCVVPFGVAAYLVSQDRDPVAVDRPTPSSPTPPPSPAPPPAPPAAPPSAPGAPPPPTTPSGSPRHVRMEITRSDGVPALSVGATCEFDVERHDRPDGTFWCRAQVTCGGSLLFGGPRAGYFDCTLYERPERHVVGEDPSTTQADTDAAFRIDTLRQEVEIRDDASGPLGRFTVQARVLDVR